MGYFSNGTEGDMYEARYCNRCVHQGGPDGPGCAVWGAHLFANYAECNNENSILHMLIRRDKQGNNLKCEMFHQRGGRGGGQPQPLPLPLTIVKAA